MVFSLCVFGGCLAVAERSCAPVAVTPAGGQGGFAAEMKRINGPLRPMVEGHV